MARQKSLSEVNSSIDTTNKTGFWKKLFAFVGPAYLVSVGYMDPGNWATDIAGGSKYGYTLLWVLLMSNLMALLLQSLSARLGLVRGLDLAQACRTAYPPVVNFFNWLLAEVAIAACDLAEVVGMAIGLKLLFHLPMLTGVTLTVADTLLILVFQKYGMRKMEAFILALIATIGLAFIIELFLSHPNGAELVKGFVPYLPNDNTALYIASGIIGATVMPHNLYLHSSLVQTRKIARTPEGIREAIRFNFLDTGIALNMALFVNAAILILAASAFYSNGLHGVTSIEEAHQLLNDILGTKFAPMLFAIALIAAGQSSTLTGTLSGQIIMEGYLNLRIQPWLRRLITRLVAIIPAFLVIYIFGESSTEELLVLSQVILSMQLGFAIIPLIHLTSDSRHMGKFANKLWVRIAAWSVAFIIIYLNVKLVVDALLDWDMKEIHPWIYYGVCLIAMAAGVLLLYITFTPILRRAAQKHGIVPDGQPEELKITSSKGYRKIAITVDFTSSDSKAISGAFSQGGKDAEYILVHVVETAGARMMKEEIHDLETTSDKINLDRYEKSLTESGYKVSTRLGFGNPKKSIPEIVNSSGCDLLVMGAHGHRAFKDIILGTTLDAVRHHVKMPVLIVK